jgi:hypothetical protein
MAVNIENVRKYLTYGNVYVGCAIPPPNCSLLDYASNGVPSGGTDIGATQGETIFTYTPTFEAIDVDQSVAPIKPYLTSEEMTLSFSMAEPTITRLPIALGTSLYSPTTLHLGGNLTVTGACVCVVAEQPNNKGTYVAAMLYNALGQGISRSFKRGQATIVDVELRAFAMTDDLARLGQYAEGVCGS